MLIKFLDMKIMYQILKDKFIMTLIGDYYLFILIFVIFSINPYQDLWSI